MIDLIFRLTWVFILGLCIAEPGRDSFFAFLVFFGLYIAGFEFDSRYRKEDADGSEPDA